MSTYKFKLSKRYLVSQDDSSAWAPNAESYADSTSETQSKQDIDVGLYLDDVLKHTITVTDSGGTLEFTETIAQGAHTIRIVPIKDPVQYTDVCVDQLIIDDVVTVATQYDYNARVSGTASTLRQKLAYPNHKPFNYIWWGNTIANDSSLNLEGPFYRPTIVADHQSAWVWDFNITASGMIWFQDHGTITDIMYDSSAQHTYYLAQVSSDSMDIIDNDIFDSSTAPEDDHAGSGTYQLDSNNDFVKLSDSMDESAEDANSIVIYTVDEQVNLYNVSLWHQSNTVTATIIT